MVYFVLFWFVLLSFFFFSSCFIRCCNAFRKAEDECCKPGEIKGILMNLCHFLLFELFRWKADLKKSQPTVSLSGHEKRIVLKKGIYDSMVLSECMYVELWDHRIVSVREGL